MSTVIHKMLFQVRIILNKADEITMPELLKIQNNLVWQVSPHMASLEPPRFYAGSFWSHPYKPGAAKELLQNQEASLFRDIRDAINKRIQNRISTARRFAVSILEWHISCRKTGKVIDFLYRKTRKTGKNNTSIIPITQTLPEMFLNTCQWFFFYF